MNNRLIALAAILAILLVGIPIVYLLPKYLAIQYCKNLSDSPNCGKWGCGSSVQDKCFYGLAQNYSDKNLCNETYFPSSCKASIAISKNDALLCADDQECIEDYAVRTLNLSICDLMKSYDAKSECMYNVIIANEDIVSDWNICENLSNIPKKRGSDRTKCYIVAAIETRDISYCSKITEKSKDGDTWAPGSDYGCYVALSQITENQSICNLTDFITECNEGYDMHLYHERWRP